MYFTNGKVRKGCNSIDKGKISVLCHFAETFLSCKFYFLSMTGDSLYYINSESFWTPDRSYYPPDQEAQCTGPWWGYHR